MTLDDLRSHCMNKPGYSEDLPFDERTLAFRVGGKIFALMDIEAFDSVNLKCDPDRSVELREQYSGIRGGYHMNKRHWNTVATDGSVPHRLVLELADHSYDLVLGSLSRRIQEAIGKQPGRASARG